MNYQIYNQLESTDSVTDDFSSLLPGYLITTAVLLMSAFFVLPGMFDTTLTSRVGIYPLTALILLWAGREHIPLWAVTVSSLLLLLPLLGMLWAPIPAQGILPAVKWASFGMMIAGAAGISEKYGDRSVWLSMVTAAALVAVAEILPTGDLPWGNPNRPGAILVVGFVLSCTGAAFRRNSIRIPVAVLTGIALILTSFITALIAAGIAVFWLIINSRVKLHPGYAVAVLLAGQVLFTAIPQITERVAPSLELRCRIWNAGIDQLNANFPMGTGTGQSRLTLLQDAGERVQMLAGDPDRRIDHLHSDILTPIVEWGIAGVILLSLASWLIIRKRFSPLNGALLLCVLILLLVDLPLATPLGALPIALCLGVALKNTSSGLNIRIPIAVIVPFLLASIAWGLIVIRGYSLLERGRMLGISTGADNTDQVSSVMLEATSWIPFEERSWLFLSRAYLDDGKALAALDAAERFNRVYPAYWRGWMLQAQSETVLGRNEDAACSYLNALKSAPVTLPDRNIIALNAAAFPTGNEADIVFIGEALATTLKPPREVSAEVFIKWVDTIVSVAGMLPETEENLRIELLAAASHFLQKSGRAREEMKADIARIMRNILNQAELIDSAMLNAYLRSVVSSIYYSVE